MHPVIPWLAGLHSPVPDLLRVLCSACPSTPHNAIHEKLLARRAGLSPDPARFAPITTPSGALLMAVLHQVRTDFCPVANFA